MYNYFIIRFVNLGPAIATEVLFSVASFFSFNQIYLLT